MNNRSLSAIITGYHGLKTRNVIQLLAAFECIFTELAIEAIFVGILYSVQIIQKSSIRKIMHVSIIVLKLPAKLCGVSD